MVTRFIIFCIFSYINFSVCAQDELVVVDRVTGIRLMVLDREYPLLKILLPHHKESERGIEVEFPEHVTGLNDQTKQSEHLYLATMGERNRRTLPVWKKQGNSLRYESVLNGNIKLAASASLESDGIRYSYTITNNSRVGYGNLQAVTCVKLYSDFSDTLLERTHVHHPEGFELVASETPERLTMPLQNWLPCRYLVSYTWPLNKDRKVRGEDDIMRYYKSRKTDKPLIATQSHDHTWIAATYTPQTGNLWTNPERSCHHADPATDLAPNSTGDLKLKTFLYRGKMQQLLAKINAERQ